VYQWIGGDEPSDVASAAREQVDAGFTALKMNATPEIERVDNPATVEAAATRLREVREAVGPEVDIGVDFHGRVTKPMVKRLASAMEPYEPMFIEEPVLPEHNDALPALAAHTDIPIATGERMYSRWDYKEVFEDGAVDVIQPDLS
ncbi:enolase C-terminal domain-like protein, partial [Haloferax sp. KTX1]